MSSDLAPLAGSYLSLYLGLDEEEVVLEEDDFLEENPKVKGIVVTENLNDVLVRLQLEEKIEGRALRRYRSCCWKMLE